MIGKNIVTAILITVCAPVLCAEEWSLDSCINYALEHNINVKLRHADIADSELSVKEARDSYLPSMNASVGQTWNFGRGLTANNTYAERSTSNFQWGVSFNMPVFNGLRTRRRINATKADLDVIVAQYAAAKDDVTLNVIAAYLQVLYCKELNEVADQQVSLSQFELRHRTALFEAGKIPEVDLLDAESQLAEDEYNLAKCSNDVQLAIVDLVQLLELLDTVDFDVKPLSDADTTLLSPGDVYDTAINYNNSVIAARRSIVAAEKNISLARAGYMPTLAFNLGAGSSYYRVSGTDNPSFDRQMKNNYSTYFGMTLSIPIFDANSTYNSIKRAQVKRITAMLQYDNVRQQLFKSIQQAYFSADGARRKLEASKIAEKAASAAFEAMREKYNIGRATPSEYEQSKAKALNATAERIQAYYELLLRTRILQFYCKM